MLKTILKYEKFFKVKNSKKLLCLLLTYDNITVEEIRNDMYEYFNSTNYHEGFLYKINNQNNMLNIYYYRYSSFKEKNFLNQLIKDLNLKIPAGKYKDFYENMIKFYIEKNLKSLTSNISDTLNNDIIMLNKEIKQLYNDIKMLELQKLAIFNTPPKEINIDDIFKIPNVKITLRKEEQGYILDIDILAPLTQYNREEAKVLFKNSFKMIKDIFINKKFILYFRNIFNIDITKGTIIREDTGYNGNPHINRYDCWENYRNKAIIKLHEHDLYGTISYLMAAVSSITISDSTVMNYFISIISTLSGIKNLTFYDIENKKMIKGDDLYEIY